MITSLFLDIILGLTLFFLLSKYCKFMFSFPMTILFSDSFKYLSSESSENLTMEHIRFYIIYFLVVCIYFLSFGAITIFLRHLLPVELLLWEVLLILLVPNLIFFIISFPLDQLHSFHFKDFILNLFILIERTSFMSIGGVSIYYFLKYN